MTIQELDRRAVEATVELVSLATPEDLARPTPCAEWTLRELLAHMSAQHRGFAAAARGGGGDLAAWAVRPDGGDPVGDYAKAAEEVRTAFAEDGVLEREFALAEFGPDIVVPASQAIGFHLVDYVVHGWDVARAIGAPFDPDEDILAATLPIVLAVPDGPERLEPGAAFRPGLATSPDASTLDRILAALGRSPVWPR